MNKIKDKVALVAGATSEIGEAIIFQLMEAGATIAVCDKAPDTVENLVKKVKDAGGKAIGVTADVTAAAEVKSAVASVIDQCGQIDILVNNFDEPAAKGITGLSLQDWENAIDSSLSPIFYFLKEVAPVMQKNNYGRIINISSIDYLGMSGKANIAAARSGILGFTRSAALELAKNNITVNSVVKGDISNSQMSDEEAAGIAKRIPVKKIGSPADIANAVGFFAADVAHYMTGQTFFVCGGKSVHYSLSV